eukprot:1739537-Heterocapsa_arctica.AAC.1
MGTERPARRPAVWLAWLAWLARPGEGEGKPRVGCDGNMHCHPSLAKRPPNRMCVSDVSPETIFNNMLVNQSNHQVPRNV